MAQHAIIVPAESHNLVNIKLDFDGSLNNLQKTVGGYIEVVRMTAAQKALLLEEVAPLVAVMYGATTKLDISKAVLVVNEEGLLQDLPVNAAMTEIMGQVIVGDVVVTLVE
jgi:hypothetical protein